MKSKKINNKLYELVSIPKYGECYVPVIKRYPKGMYGQWFSDGVYYAFLARVDNGLGGVGSVRLSLLSYPSCNLQNAALSNMTEEEAHEKVASHGWNFKPKLTMGLPRDVTL
jgi:hypothetical protein